MSETQSPTATPFTLVVTAPLSTPTASPSPWPLSVSYVSPGLSYRIQLPEGYRRSECLSGVASADPRSRPFLGAETFTLLSPEDERAVHGPGHIPVSGPAQAWTFFVTAYATEMSAVELAERDGCYSCERVLPNPSPAPDPLLGRPPVDRIETLTIAGQEAARRIRDRGGSFYVVRAGARAYLIRFQEAYTLDPARPRPVELGADPLAAIAATFRADPTAAIVFRTPRPEAVPAAARDVAVQVAEAFEAGDVDRIAALTTPSCWLDVIVEPGGGSAEPVSRYVAQLRTRFAAGLRVRADPTLPAASDTSGEPTLSFRSEWTEGGRTWRVDLRLREVDGRWYWGGLYQFAPR